MTVALSFVLFVLMTFTGLAQAQQDAVMKAMQDELGRSMSQLRMAAMEKPYFLGYRLDDLDDTTVAASLGSVTQNQAIHRRLLGVELRVGDYALDNSNFMSFRTFGAGMSRMFSAMAEVPLDDNYLVLRRQLWLATDTEYKKALEDLSTKRAALQNRTRAEALDDFSRAQPSQMEEPAVAAKLDVASAEQFARELSALFRDMPQMLTSAVTLESHNTFTRYVNSEGTMFTRPQLLLRLEVRARTQAADGQPLEDTLEFFGRTLADLPAKETIAAQIREMGTRLAKLRDARFAERYNGPVLFEGEAAAEVFAQVFAPGLIAQRMPTSDNPQFEMAMEQLTRQMGGSSFLERIGGRVLPESVDVVDDPLLRQFEGAKLAGSYKVDDEGVPARATRLVEKGMLKTLLATRTPVPTIAHSTGNRRGSGPAPSNLIVTSDKTASDSELRQELLRRARLCGRDYGIVVRRVGGGGLDAFARLQAFGPRENAPSTTLLAVYKLFPDGHEELVRGAEVADLTAAAFRDIVGVGDKPVVYSDQFTPRGGALLSMGLISIVGGPPVVSYVVPSLLFEEIAVKKTAGPFPQPPASPSPLGEARK
jgi:predicted Zn-dependent protease